MQVLVLVLFWFFRFRYILKCFVFPTWSDSVPPFPVLPPLQVLDGLLAQCGTVENCEQGKTFIHIKSEELTQRQGILWGWLTHLHFLASCAFWTLTLELFSCFLTVLHLAFLLNVSGWMFARGSIKRFESSWILRLCSNWSKLNVPRLKLKNSFWWQKH